MSSMDDETRLVSQSDLAGRVANFTVAPGAVLRHTYRIDKLLARGGMGEVYRASHVKLGTEHAIKIILPELAKDSKVIDLFTREAAVLRNVRNEAVVGYDGVVCDEDGHLYLIMEFVDGPALSSVLKDGPLPVQDVLLLRDRLAMGLGAAHETGVIHRDMSPDNVILPGGRLENAKIIDFGIAKLADPEAMTVIGGDFAGKYSYASPEQLGLYGGQVDARSDIYSAGLVLAAAAVGRPLDMGKTHMSVLEARRTVPDLSDVPAALRDEIAWMLEPNPDERPQSMAALKSAAARARSKGKAGGKGGRKGGVITLVAGLGALVLVGVGVGGYVFLADDDDVVAGQLEAGDTVTAEAIVTALTPGSTELGSAAGGTDRPTQVTTNAPAASPPGGTAAVGSTSPLGGARPAASSTTPLASPAQPAANPPVTTNAPLTAQQAEAPAVQLANVPNRVLIENEVNEVLAGFQCSGLSATLTDDLRVMVSGYLAGDDDQRRLLNALSSVNGIRGVIESTSIRPWPFCAAMGVLEAQAGVGSGRGGSPLIRPNNDSLVYQQNDSLVIRATATDQFEGYLYVDFIDKEGNVYHLFPTDRRPDNRVSPGGMVVVGGGPGGYPGDPNLVINPPFGTDMIVAISTPVRLFSEPRPFAESASSYLQALSEGLTALARRGFATPAAGSYVFITSRPQG